ncbi:protein MAINTENANCE OF PSII UNDER HIGH LIGHT 1-like [Bidens hawaiensis]|uniref:protein MAINTENANCE OF PSII UNDER HIGH LIGHT 1-like n=1 Tax=Bidens hawaiensis TaxID=980011 RepID=UPI00404988DF
MASSATALSANSCSTHMRVQFFNNNRYKNHQKQNLRFFKIRASSDEQEDCNVEECAPDKEVGKVSVEWLAGEKTKVAGTFPPRRREWSGYVEKDTAGQTNIYSVEPAIYVAESAISSGTQGTSSDGSENTAGAVGFGALIAVAAAAVILLQVGKNSPQIQTLDYSGPSLSYYITKFKPSKVVQISVPAEPAPAPASEPESSTPQVDSVAPATEVESLLTEPEPQSSTTPVDSGAPATEASTSVGPTESGAQQVLEQVVVESG